MDHSLALMVVSSVCNLGKGNRWQTRGLTYTRSLVRGPASAMQKAKYEASDSGQRVFNVLIPLPEVLFTNHCDLFLVSIALLSLRIKRPPCHLHAVAHPSCDSNISFCTKALEF